MDDDLHRMGGIEVRRAQIGLFPGLVNVNVLSIVRVRAGEEIKPNITIRAGPIDDPDTVTDGEAAAAFFHRNRNRSARGQE